MPDEPRIERREIMPGTSSFVVTDPPSPITGEWMACLAFKEHPPCVAIGDRKCSAQWARALARALQMAADWLEEGNRG